MVAIGAFCAGNEWHSMGGVKCVRRLVLLAVLPSKVTMVMMTFSAFLIEKLIA